MSGGAFNYKQLSLVEELFGYRLKLSYGEEGFEQSRKAAKVDPFEDVEISEMFWDTMVLVYSLDWYKSGDTSESQYREDVQKFREKWFGKTKEERLNHLIENATENFREQVTQIFKECD